MLRKPGLIVALAALVAGMIAIVAADLLPARGSCVETPGVSPVRLRALARGFNLAGQLDNETAPLMYPQQLRILRERGMTHIRLPLPAESIMPHFTEAAAIARQLLHVELILDDILALGYAVTLDLHPGPPFQRLHRENGADAMAMLKQAWGSLAPLIKRLPADRVFAELLNEPDIDAARWQTEARELVDFVREWLPDTTLIVGPVNWQRADSLPSFEPLDDRNIVYAVHFYDPMAFTHQGHWDPNDPFSNIRELPFPVRRDDPAVTTLRTRLVAENKDKALKELDAAIAASDAGDVIVSEFAPAIEWQRRTRRPLIVNEFGVLKHHAPRASRAAWIGSVVKVAEANCWGWAHWELAQGFGLLNEQRTLDEDVSRALLGR